MSELETRPACEDDFAAILALNQAAIDVTGPMDMSHLTRLHNWSDCHQVVTDKGQVKAFLLVLAAGTPYQSPNYQWFNKHYPAFLYVDRIVVDPAYTGMKIGSQLYQELFTAAKNRGIKYISCEYNIQPMNMTSHKFHKKHGFNEVSTQWLDNNRKQVSLQVAKVK